MQARPGTCTWPVVVTWAMGIYTEPRCCMATDLDMTLGSIMSWDFTAASGDLAAYSPRALPFYP